ncbi:carbonic anhydrase [Nisaea acidiphila]|uniref:Carbonic anhydrase n=1 Tax=Nisaea acidiphila TaxID=1862145 RepID=A0A9J7AXU1_9PROT|nr:carbonic anhydrase [Nisaea acidiphila]UUX52215.1 carbonic anhydrase [Nisaea acidiphila]
MPDLSSLLQHNVAWAEGKLREDPAYFEKLSGLQAPEYLWIGCSDSRVPANVITGLAPGEVFVHRNVANLVHPGDLNMLSVLEFAIEVLGVKHVIVCGHYGCGGVYAAVDGKMHGIVDHWLQPIRDVAERYASELEGCADPEERHKKLCELNVRSQVQTLGRTPIVQATWAAGKSLQLHGWAYGLEDGRIRDLDCSISGTDGLTSRQIALPGTDIGF